MNVRTIITTAIALAALQIALFTWLKTDISALSSRLDPVVQDVARVQSVAVFVREQLAVTIPALARVQSEVALLPAVARVQSELAFVRGQLSTTQNQPVSQDRSNQLTADGAD